MKNFLIGLLICCLFISCADRKEFVIGGKVEYIEPYGWADRDLMKNDSIIYTVCWQNILLDVIFSESVVVPIWLTGWQFYEPHSKKQSSPPLQ